MDAADAQVGQGELTTVADDEAVVHVGAQVRTYDELPADTVPARRVHHAARGELLSRITTVNDVHFGETTGHIDGAEGSRRSRSGRARRPYPELMAGCGQEMATAARPRRGQGDLTSSRTGEEYQRFLGCTAPSATGWCTWRQPRATPVCSAAWPMGAPPAGRDGRGARHLRDGRVNGACPPTSSVARRARLAPTGRCSCSATTCGTPTRPADDVFGIVPGATGRSTRCSHGDALLGYFADHTHRNRVVRLPGSGKPFVGSRASRTAGTWAVPGLRGVILQVHRRISTEALEWSERTATCSVGCTRATRSAASTSATSHSMSDERPRGRGVPAASPAGRRGQQDRWPDLRVIDITVIAGPGCARYLADRCRRRQIDSPAATPPRTWAGATPPTASRCGGRSSAGASGPSARPEDPDDLEVMLSLCDTADVLVELPPGPR